MHTQCNYNIITNGLMYASYVAGGGVDRYIIFFKPFEELLVWQRIQGGMCAQFLSTY